MQGNHLFEYAVVRVVPRVEREEFLNAGVILYCRDQQFLRISYHLDEKRILSLCEHIDVTELHGHLKALENICLGNEQGGPIGKLDLASRFRWLTATRSTVLQTSKVHPGLCEDAGAMMHRLFAQLVN
jgi:DUF3037 family protein